MDVPAVLRGRGSGRLQAGGQRRCAPAAAAALILVASLAVPMASPGGGSLQAAEAECSVSRQIGEATMMRGETTIQVRPTMAVEPGDHVTTGAGARLEISCADGS